MGLKPSARFCHPSSVLHGLESAAPADAPSSYHALRSQTLVWIKKRLPGRCPSTSSLVRKQHLEKDAMSCAAEQCCRAFCRRRVQSIQRPEKEGAYVQGAHQAPVSYTASDSRSPHGASLVISHLPYCLHSSKGQNVCQPAGLAFMAFSSRGCRKKGPRQGLPPL